MNVFIDLDGVLANLAAALCQAANIPYRDELFSPGQADWVAIGLTSGQFWTLLADESFWAAVPPYPYATDLVNFAAYYYGRDQVFIASAPSTVASCSGKAAWIQRHLPPWIRHQYVLTDQKHLLAHRSILVDDCLENLVAFKRQVFVPRPWNDAPPVPDIYNYICGELSKFFKPNFRNG